MNRDRAQYEEAALLVKDGRVHAVEGLPDVAVVEGRTGLYLLTKDTCTCEDYRVHLYLRLYRCKHLYAAEIARVLGVQPQPMSNEEHSALRRDLDSMFTNKPVQKEA